MLQTKKIKITRSHQENSTESFQETASLFVPSCMEKVSCERQRAFRSLLVQVETRQMSYMETGLCPVSILYICFVSTADICPVSAADICPVSTEDICPVSTEDVWLLWGHLGGDENDFDPFFTPKMHKMVHTRWSRWSHGNDATGRAAEPRSTRAGGQDYGSS